MFSPKEETKERYVQPSYAQRDTRRTLVREILSAWYLWLFLAVFFYFMVH